MPYDPATGQNFGNNSWHNTFPMARGLPPRPNPLARSLPIQTVKADVSGIQQAMDKRAESCGASMSRSSAGEGKVKYKIGDDDLKKGAEAFATLDNYMKKAGLNSFQEQFFSRLIQSGMNHAQIKLAVAKSIELFGNKVASELTDGMQKIAFFDKVGPFATKVKDFIPKAYENTKNFFGGFFGGKAPPIKNLSIDDFNTPMSDFVGPLRNSSPYLAGAGARQAAGNLRKDLYEKPFTTAKDLLTGEGAGTGAFTGALNPVTGWDWNLKDENDEYTTSSVLGGLTNLGARAGAGALGGRLMSRIGGQQFGDVAKRVQQRGLGGQVMGGGLGMVSDSMGLTENAQKNLGRLGYFGGLVAPGSLSQIPGVAGYTPRFLQNFMNAPSETSLNSIKGWLGSLGVGGIGAGAYGLARMPFAVEDRLKNIDQLAANANQLVNNANQAVSPFTQLGNFYLQNQGLINPMLGGLAGAGLGYAAGGTPGMTMGGMGGVMLPLILQMAAQGNNNGNLYQTIQNLNNARAAQLPDELARQKAYQASLMRNAASGYGR
jgi:hypothetical protein